MRDPRVSMAAREEASGLPERYTQRETSRIVGVEPGRLRYWQRLRLVVPQSRWGERFYNFRDLVALRSIKAITERKIPARKLCRAVAILRKGYAGDGTAIGELRLFASGREIAAIPPNAAGAAIEPLTGQLLLPFHAAISSAKIRQMESRAADELFEYAIRCEARRDGLHEAMRLYRQVIEMQPKWCEPHVNLGCVFYQLGELENAQKAFRDALELEPGNAIAHFNLGCVLDELGDMDQAIQHLRRATEIEPHHGDAHFNLASAYEKHGQKKLALHHWISYLQIESKGPWADYARAQLNRNPNPRIPAAPIPFRPRDPTSGPARS
ncbi:MAG: tetratricopeptide repeat protein [Candidatus Acidiferrales bacterium]